MKKVDSINIPDIHIGNEIKKYLMGMAISQAKIARAMNMPATNLNRVLKRKSTDTRMLIQLCNAAEYNFFLLWCIDTPTEQPFNSFPLKSVAISDSIRHRMQEIKMTQTELGGYLGVTSQEISRLIKKESFDTDMLAEFSRILRKNFFYDCYLPSPPQKTIPSDNILLDRYDNLVIENSRLKQELSAAQMEIARLTYTV